ncbi:Stage II sporulation protein E (SpoIIE) [Mycobacterium bohemicum DSM 44277]|uniref:Serine/threonine protein phosphatase n=2 Tax=Mycobacterium bohemicum TaxID=56425 RepID=A0A1X1RDM5_MYCBE|nr:PP2C family protein-serine/threonine phosphatase [Mycobacterium bohemicum]MCV6972724.1 serine/threonine-protein phosphatase [Mycobacterium bohemicum]ORV03573.1 serine/threonine protein phosphatase [Mycobacterium bohemicum]CPR04056.1 Stage II sporulation protein E (SpoIIE) [Mycobacterium bohemicum DSM 44277]
MTGVETELDALWAAVPCPTLVVGRAGEVRALSASAQEVLPDMRLGAPVEQAAPWLSEAHDRLVSTTPGPDGVNAFVVSGSVGGRKFDAHAAVLPGGEVVWSLVEDTGQLLREAQRALAKEQERTAFLLEASSVLTASLNVDRCREATVQMAARHLADAAVMVAPAGRGRRLPVFSSGVAGAVEQCSVDADPATVPGLSEALHGFPPVSSGWIDPAMVPNWLMPQTLTEPIGSVMIVSLPGHGVSAGALVLLRDDNQPVFSDDEEVFARLFAARAGAALSAARLYAEQAAITRTLMRDLLPPPLHGLHGIEFAGGYRASKDYELVGGDFYDFHPAATPEDETLVVLGDVCGKGLEAAVMTGKIRNTLQALTPLADNHEDVLTLLNRAMLSAEHARFATLVLASVAYRDGAVLLRLTCAGHPAPLILRDGGHVEEADTRGTLVGAFPRIKVHTFETMLAPGETCVMYTDGVTEARGGPLGEDFFGEERLASALTQCAGMPAEAVVERVLMLTTQWVGQRAHDDIAVVAITAPRRTHLSAVDGHTRGRYIA